MKVGSDFSGIGSPEVALKNLQIEFEHVFACDVDEYAKKSFLAIHKPQVFFDDIRNRNHGSVKRLDMYFAGFPCQAFSIAGKRKGFEDVRGTLFFDTAEFIRINRPKVFVLENVKGLLNHDGGNTFKTIIDLLSNGGGTINGQMSLDMFEDGLGYHLHTCLLNTKDFGLPQNRERIFIIGFDKFAEFRIPKGQPLTTRLIDVLETDVDEKFYLKQKQIDKLVEYNKRQIANGNGFMAKFHNPNEDLMSALKVGGGNADDLVQVVAHSLFPRSSKTGKGGSGHLSKNDGTIYCIDAQNTQAIEVRQLNPSKESGGVQPYQQNRIYDINGLCPSLNAGQQQWNGNIVNTKQIRRLTPLECWKLQGFSKTDFFKAEQVCSNSQLYKQAGNTISVPVIQAIIKNITDALAR
jgi:DNA (cytosine-5)-methyltransferase 1